MIGHEELTSYKIKIGIEFLFLFFPSQAIFLSRGNNSGSCSEVLGFGLEVGKVAGCWKGVIISSFCLSGEGFGFLM
jgi:hypothetical protein